MANEWIAIAPSAVTAGDAIVPAIDPVEQKPYQYLCWAAAGEVMFQNVNVALSLPDLVSKLFGDGCRQDLHACDKTAWPYQLYSAYRCRCMAIDAPMSADLVRQWNQYDYAVQAYFEWDRGDTHTVVIAGTYANGDLLIFDSLQHQALRVSYSSACHAYRAGKWTKTWWNITQ